MPDTHTPPTARLTRRQASDATGQFGWRYLLDCLSLSVPVGSLEDGSALLEAVLEAAGPGADAHLRIDLRPDRVVLSLQDRSQGWVTRADTAMAERISNAVQRAGRVVAEATSTVGERPVQTLELAIDALDIAAIRPFWKAVLGYVDEPGRTGPSVGLVDPAGQMPAVWFQQMDHPRPERNRIHFDLTVAHDEAAGRIEAALAAGGHLVDDSHARAFWVLADAEGNEVCVCTWQDRDRPAP